MTATELVVEKAKNLSESQAELVLAYIDDLAASHHVSALDLMQLPASRRRAILQLQATKAEGIYRGNPALICEDADDPLPWEQYQSVRTPFKKSPSRKADSFDGPAELRTRKPSRSRQLSLYVSVTETRQRCLEPTHSRRKKYGTGTP